MPFVKPLITLILLLALQQQAYGYDSSEDRINDYRRILLAHDFDAKCDVLKHLQWAGLNDLRIFDWVEEYVLEFYQSSFLSRERFTLKRQAIRALAYSGNEKYRYSLFLVEVEAAGKDIRHDGKLALAQLDKHIEWQQIIKKSDYQFAHKHIVISRYMTMLSIENTGIKQLAASGIYHERIKDTELLALAFQQWQTLQSQRSLTDQQQSTRRWLLKAIDRNTNRYSHHYDRR
jgi:hypothetical protein